MLCRSFPPRVNKHSKILILGSMPGIKSLEMQQYYAHPQNRFWILMGKLCNETDLTSFEYEKRIETLLLNGFALWDVIKCCKREGSLDSAINNEIPNDIEGLLVKYSGIETIFLNGNKSYSAFKKHFPNLLIKYNCFKHPSTSPANARYSLNDLVKEWQKGVKFG